MNHVSDDLPRLLSGEATRDEVLDAAAHLRSCADCREELVSAVVAHASLTSVHRFAPEIMAAVDEPSASPTASLPDLSAMFAQVRAEAVEPTGNRPRRRLAFIAAGVVAGAAAGSIVTAVVTHGSSSAPAGRTIALAAFDEGRVGAKATMSGGDHLVVDASGLPKPAQGSRYEIWLTNSGRTAMQPVGWIGEDGKADVVMPTSLVNAYDHLEVSVQRIDAPYTYSGDSVLRGSY
jgi:hypothetical protein